MTTQSSTKVRLVRCPRCWQILPELPNVSLYSCGGCGTTLLAKNRGRDVNLAGSSSQEMDSTPQAQLDGVVEEKEARSVAGDSTRPPSVGSSPDNEGIHCRDAGGGSSSGLSLQEKYYVPQSHQDGVEEERESGSLSGGLIRPSSVKSLPEKDNISCHDDRVNCSVDVSHGRSIADGCLNSLKVNHNIDAAVENEESLKQEGSLGENRGKYDSRFRDGSGSSSDDIPSSGEIACEAEADAPEANEPVEAIDGNYAHQDNEMDQIEGGESRRESQEGDDDFIDEIQHLPELEDEETIFAQDSEDREGNEHSFVAPEDDEKSRISSADPSEVSDGGIMPVRLDSDSGLISNGNNTLPLSEALHVEVDADEQHVEVDDEAEGQTNCSTRGSIVASRRSWNESLASVYLTCPEDEHPDRSPREATHNYERNSSIDTLASSSLAELSSELISKYRSTNNFLPSSSYYAYDGSESSYDGTDDHINKHFPKRREIFERNGFVGQSEPETSYWATGYPRRPTKSGHQGPEKSTEVNEYTTAFSRRHGDASRLQCTLKDPVASNKVKSPSSYRHSLLPPRPGVNSSAKGSYSEADEVDLLRRVYELKDQLNRMQFPKIATGRRSPPGAPTGKFNHSRYNHLTPEEELCSDLNDHGSEYHRRRDMPQGYAEGCVSRLAFSGEASHYRHRLSCSCLRCHRRDRHYSAQLPAHSVHCRNSCCGMSPQHYTSSELSLWGCESEPDDQRRDSIKQLRLKEKYQSAKKRLLPVAGGAPLIACYHCWQLLQLPTDFLLFKKQCHRLRCNACLEVLKFSLLKGSRLVPYVPVVSNPPPSVADDHDNAAGPRNPGPAPHSGSYQRVEAVSCSDCGQSFCRSCSTEGEAGSVISASVEQIWRNSYNRKMSSGSSNGAIENRKMKSVMGEVASAGPSSQKAGTSEIEEVDPSSNSPLHQLMGYSSPSQVFIK